MEGWFIAIIIGAVIGLSIRVVRGWLTSRNLVTGERRATLLSELRKMQSDGAGFQEQMSFLKGHGLRTNVAEGLITDCTRQQPPVIDKPETAKRGGFGFKYPANWKLKALDEDMDSERHFLIESPSSAFLIFNINEPDLDVEGMIQEQSQQMEQVPLPKMSPWRSWGEFDGEGMTLEGVANKHPVRFRCFRWQSGDHSVLVSEHCMAEELEIIKPGFKLIERSFRALTKDEQQTD